MVPVVPSPNVPPMDDIPNVNDPIITPSRAEPMDEDDDATDASMVSNNANAESAEPNTPKEVFISRFKNFLLKIKLYFSL